MSSRFRVPKLTDPNIVIRSVANQQETDAANWLVFRNYVQDGFWEDDPSQLKNNNYLHTSARNIFVAVEDSTVVGTISVILDSSEGLPSDGSQVTLMQNLRRPGNFLAEISAFAMERSKTSHQKLFLFLWSYMLQYSFYHAGVDRLVASCKPKHADFYESVFGFSKVSDLTYYSYSHAVGYLISLNLIEAHQLLSAKYPPDAVTGESLYHFLLRDSQPCQRFAPGSAPKRSRAHNWLEVSLKKVA